MNVWALHAKDGGGTIESHHRCMDVCKRMRRSGACGYACLTMRPLTNHTHTAMGHCRPSAHFGLGLESVICIKIINLLHDLIHNFYCERLNL